MAESQGSMGPMRPDPGFWWWWIIIIIIVIIIFFFFCFPMNA